MQYTKFHIRNYRGIEDTIIELPQGEGSRVTTLIGLNESGKTTILEAIYSFSPDPESKALYEETVLLSDDPSYYIPRGEFSNFNGEISVEAVVEWEDGEKQKAIDSVRSGHNINIDPQSIPDVFTITSKRTYKNSVQTIKGSYWGIQPRVKTGRQQNFRNPTASERATIVTAFLGSLPRIAYFPTFVFQFPERIFLKGGDGRPVNEFYKSIFEAILKAGGEGHSIKEHIVGRFESIRRATITTKAIETAGRAFGARSTEEMITQTVEKAADTVSDLIVAKWDEMFKNSPLKKEVKIQAFDDYTTLTDGEGNPIEKHDVWVEFKVRDDGKRYNISDRSLGFRWFFCFLLFTRFMSSSSKRSRVLFLFDEPASNLHAKAQEKLLENFSAISEFPNSLIFSTHSHYMIEPTWLERAYVVRNDAINYSDAGGEGASGTKARSTRIEAIRYRRFVSESGASSDSATYYQPVLDRLEVKPSQLDLQSECIVVEGKSDFHILSYTKRIYNQNSAAIVPALGATTMKPVVGILRGWATRFLVLLDADKAGKAAADAYAEEIDLAQEVRLLNFFAPGAKEIEDLFSDEDLTRIQAQLKLDHKPRKKTLSRLFQEANASGTKLPLTRKTVDALRNLLTGLNTELGKMRSLN